MSKQITLYNREDRLIINEHKWNCTKCACYYANQKPGSGIYEAMELAQIACSNEKPEAENNNGAGTCDCFQPRRAG